MHVLSMRNTASVNSFEHERALDYFERAVARREVLGGRDVEQEFVVEHDEKPHSIAFVHVHLARVQWAPGEHDDARARVEQAKELATNAGPLDRRSFAPSRSGSATDRRPNLDYATGSTGLDGSMEERPICC